MNLLSFLREFYDWTEAWAPIFPIVAWPFASAGTKKKVTPSQYYFFVALILNILIDVSWKFKYHLGPWAENNNVFYNVQSLIRGAVFLTFFYINQTGWFKKGTLWIAIVYGVFLIADYSFKENILSFSSYATTSEAIALLLASLLYLFKTLGDDELPSLSSDPNLWITVGLLLYVTTNFAIFLLYSSLMQTDTNFAVSIWDIHNAFYLIFCLLSAKAYYGTRRV